MPNPESKPVIQILKGDNVGGSPDPPRGKPVGVRKNQTVQARGAHDAALGNVSNHGLPGLDDRQDFCGEIVGCDLVLGPQCRVLVVHNDAIGFVLVVVLLLLLLLLLWWLWW